MSGEEETEPKYLNGFGNTFSSESIKCPGALPTKQYHPREFPYGLYHELLSGTSFTTPRRSNQHTIMYRIHPSVKHRPFQEFNEEAPHLTNDWSLNRPTPNQTSWLPFDFPEESQKVDFVQGIKTLCGAGDPTVRSGLAIHVYTCNSSMKDKCFYNSDGDFLIVPQMGNMQILTELGKMNVKPTEFIVIPQGFKFSVSVKGPTRGYILEVFNNHFVLPELGPLGTVGLADPRHFEHPTAWFEDRTVQDYSVVNKYQGNLFVAKQDHSPFDVVAWHGNYSPYKYNLSNYLAVGSVTYDHLDPSIYTVLVCPSEKPGVSIADFVVFPPRWIVSQHSFLPPPQHRNCMAEFMGLIFGNISTEHGLKPGGASLHGAMTPHGPEIEDYAKVAKMTTNPPFKSSNYMSLMFETCLSPVLTKWAAHTCKKIDPDYYIIWQGIKKTFDPNWKPPISEDHLKE